MLNIDSSELILFFVLGRFEEDLEKATIEGFINKKDEGTGQLGDGEENKERRFKETRGVARPQKRRSEKDGAS